MNRRYLKLALILCVAIAGAVVLHAAGLTAWLNPEKLRTLVSSFGVFGPIVFMAAYLFATVLFLPGSPLSLLGGALFGPVYGTFYVVVGATLGAVVAFLLSRTAGSFVLRGGEGGIADKLKSYDERIARHGLATVLFLRLVPLFPFNGLNFALGLTRVRFRDYALGTFFGIMPGTFAFVYFGDSLASLSVVQIAGALLLIGGVIILGRFIARRYSPVT